MAADLAARIRSFGFPRSWLASVLELAGAVAVVYGVWLIYRPAAFLVGGVLAVVAAQALDSP